jgi:hypothetical protein
VRPSGVINLGEADQLLHRAEWVNAPAWGLRKKFRSDFDEPLMLSLDERFAGEPRFVGSMLGPVQAVVFGGNATATALDTSSRHTDNALQTAQAHTERALSRSYHNTLSWLRRMSEKVKQ